MQTLKDFKFTPLTETASFKRFNRMIRTYQAAKIITAVCYTAISLALVLSPLWVSVSFTLLVKSFIIFAMVVDWQDRFGSSPRLKNWAGASWLGLLVTMTVGYFVGGRPGLYGMGYCLAMVVPWLVVVGWYINKACQVDKK